MKFSMQWLQKLVKLDVSPAKLSAQFTDSGLEVESLEGDVIEVAVPPNRADCLGMVGIAREAAALNNIAFVVPAPIKVPVTTSDKFTLQVQNPQACPKYLGRIIKGINNTVTTPQWIQDCLTIADIKIISPVVDITNYVLIEWGQPLHAFDLSKIQDQTIVVRNSKAGESLVLLDESTVTLDSETLLIADSKKPLALAGIKGGMSSGVAADTKDILIECAYFEPIGIRASSKRNKIQTDGSYRFERGIDPTMQLQVMERVTQLMLEIVGGQAGEIVCFEEQKILPKPVELTLRTERINKILGIKVEKQKVINILQNLDMKVEDVLEKLNTVSSKTELLKIQIPPFRTDIAREIDLIEEVARIIGYDNIPAQLSVGTLAFNKQPESQLTESQVLNCMINRGYNEAITYSFIDSKLATLFVPSINEAWCLTNPISMDMNLMRPSLLPGLISALQHNQNRQQERVRLFEIGLRFEGDKQSLQQTKTLAAVCSGGYLAENWANPARAVDFYDLKADIVELFKLAHNAVELEFRPAKIICMHPGQSVEIYLGTHKIGVLGALHPAIAQKLGLESKTFMFELNYLAISNGKLATFNAISKYPAVRRDLALLVDRNLPAAKLENVIKKEAGILLTEVVIFDVYQGKGIADDKKSVGLGLTLQDTERTLTEAEVNGIFDNVIAALKREFNAVLR